MIHVTISRLESGLIHEFTLSGHADYAKRGKDIVCAAATAVSFGTVNAIEALAGFEPKAELGKGGFLRCEFPMDIPEETQKKVQILLEGMIVSLQTIEKDYGKHIKITFQ
ncbi:ribosomal-processing cysteine protease Prp [Pseudoneobacillus sp. C159]